MIEFYQGQEIILSQQAKTNNGVILDLTNAVVTTTISDSSGGSSYIITKSSTDSSQINIISATNGLYKIIINSIESNYLSKGRWIVKSSIVISTHTYIVENTIYIKETANDTYTIYTIENAKSLTYTELSNLITNDDLIVGGQYLITDFTDGDNEGLLVTAKSADELNSIANVVGDTDNYVYNVSTNTVTSLSKVIESLENKTIDLADNNVINQIEVTYEQLTTLIASNSLKKGNKYLILNRTETGSDLIVTAKTENTLEPFAYLNPSIGEDNYIYVYDVTTNTAEYLKAIVESLENKTIDYNKNTVSNQIPVTYAQLTTLISSNGLKKGNKYLIDDFQETWTGGSKDPEKIVVTASSTNTLERVAASITNPSDYIEYTVENTLIAGATKGVILKRIDSNRNEFGYSYNNTINTNCYGNRVDDGFYNNVLGDSFSHNVISQYCGQNIIGNNSSGNVIGKDFNYNVVGNTFFDNKILMTFENNTIATNFYHNVIDNSFTNNTTNGSFTHNTVNEYCTNNIFGATFQYNIIHAQFRFNTLGTFYQHNEFMDSISNIDFTSSSYSLWQSHLQSTYHCKIFKNSASALCLEYINSDGQTVTLTAE